MLPILALLTLTSTAFAAQKVSDCNRSTTIESVQEPLNSQIRSLTSADVRLDSLNFPETGGASLHLAILSPPYDTAVKRQCGLMGNDTGLGFGTLDFEAMRPEFDPARGLGFTLPGMIRLKEQNSTLRILMTQTPNQSTGDIKNDNQLGNE